MFEEILNFKDKLKLKIVGIRARSLNEIFSSFLFRKQKDYFDLFSEEIKLL